MTYPFAGEIKMTKVIKDGQEVIEWEPVNMTYHADGNVGIGTPQWDCSAPLVIGEPVERMRISMTEGVGIIPGNGGDFVFTKPTTEWARVDKNLNVTHLDLDLCFKGPDNEYTALAKAIWNKAMEEAAKVCDDMRPSQPEFDQRYWQGCTDSAAAIRARG
jgi:hypothetical protein